MHTRIFYRKAKKSPLQNKLDEASNSLNVVGSYKNRPDLTSNEKYELDRNERDSLNRNEIDELERNKREYLNRNEIEDLERNERDGLDMNEIEDLERKERDELERRQRDEFAKVSTCDVERQINRLIREHAHILPMQGAVMMGHYNTCQRMIEKGVAINASTEAHPPPLCIALKKGLIDIADLLISSGADINLPYGQMYPMMFALDIKTYHVQLVKRLIDAGFPKDGIICSYSGMRTIHVAVSRNLKSVVKYLLSISADVNIKDTVDRTPLELAIQDGNLAMVDLLGKHCETSLNYENEQSGFIPLFYAIARGNCELVTLLLSLGADIYRESPYGPYGSMMPLHLAAVLAQPKVVKLLIENGADVNKQNIHTGEIPLHSAARSQVSLDKNTKLVLRRTIRLLLKYGSDIKQVQMSGLTPLQLALRAQKFDAAKCLMLCGSDLNDIVNSQEGLGAITFHLISKTADRDLITTALDCGANCMAKDAAGHYPIHRALLTILKKAKLHRKMGFPWNSVPIDELETFKYYWRMHFPVDLTFQMPELTAPKPYRVPSDIVSLVRKHMLLLEGVRLLSVEEVEKAVLKGTEVNCCSTEIPYPLHYIASKGKEAILKLFLEHGAVVNVMNKDGETPLHAAAKAGSAICCQLLLENGAMYNCSTRKFPKTPLRVAKELFHTDVVTLLKSVDKHFRGFDEKPFLNLDPKMEIFDAVTKCTGKDGRTLFDKAIDNGWKEQVERLAKLRLDYTN